MTSRCVALGAILGALLPTACAHADWDWERELRDLRYFTLHLSSIRAINGLNLSRRQATQLRELALEMAGLTPKPPTFAEPMRPELAQVRKDWLELREVLLQGGPVSAGLKKRVLDGGITAREVVRQATKPAPTAAGALCGNCHQAPRAAGDEVAPLALNRQTQRALNLAHLEATLGPEGLWRLVRLSPQVEGLLTEAQEKALGESITLPVGLGELTASLSLDRGDVDEQIVGLLRQCRQCPDDRWPSMKLGILSRTDLLSSALTPVRTLFESGAAAPDKLGVLDEVRELSEAELDLRKAELAKRARAALTPRPGELRFRATYLLLAPGASAVYDRYLARLASGD